MLQHRLLNPEVTILSSFVIPICSVQAMRSLTRQPKSLRQASTIIQSASHSLRQITRLVSGAILGSVWSL